jgi:hypothetical protein
MAQVISSHSAWWRMRAARLRTANRVWPKTCSRVMQEDVGMAEISRDLSEEYWRPAPLTGSFPTNSFHTQGSEAFCAVCGTAYAAGARYCHLCGLAREEDLRQAEGSRFIEGLDLDAIRTQFGLSNTSLVCLLLAAVFLLPALLTGLFHSATTAAEWQATQISRIEWLLATLAALLVAMLFKTRP